MIDVLVIGAGIVGLATGYKLVRRGFRVLLLEKEPAVARHQSGRNSGVLHSGIYYRPDSLKARTCVDGRRQMEEFCDEHRVPWKRTGKIIVAAEERELPHLHVLAERGRLNGVDCGMIDHDDLRRLEPNCSGLGAVHVRDAGVVDFRRVCARLAELLGTVITSAEVIEIQQSAASIKVRTTAGEFEASYLINCAGLYSDRVARLAGLDPGLKIVPFRGEYYDLTEPAARLCRTMIYPVPDPELPFLGVHFTRSVDGRVHCGPNAVLAFSREGYRRRDVNFRDLAEVLTYRGTRALGRRLWRTAVGEFVRSFSKAAFTRAAKRLIPAIRAEDLVVAPAGVRAQAVAADGSLIDDFVVRVDRRAVHVLNAPSPAATAALAIGDLVVDEFLRSKMAG